MMARSEELQRTAIVRLYQDAPGSDSQKGAFMRSQTILQLVVGMAITAGAISFVAAADLPTADKDKDMVLIPRGEFTMGSNEHADEP
jgi:formylglycine-generating enzyme required for sulfatase activity